MPERPPIILDEALIFAGAHVLGPGLADVPRPIIGCLGFWLLALLGLFKVKGLQHLWLERRSRASVRRNKVCKGCAVPC